MLRMLDVAEYAGVSVATVSNVITGKKHVSNDISIKVQKAIEELGYQVNLVARELKSKKSYNIGVLLPQLTSMFFPIVLNGIEDAAKRENYKITYLSSNKSFETEKEYVELLKNSRVDGIIIDTFCDVKYEKKWSEDLIFMGGKGKKMPVVSLERDINSELISSVMIDFEKHVRDVTKILLSRGRKNILHITAPLTIPQGIKRLKGYKEAYADFGIKPDPDYIIEGDFSPISGYKVTKSVLKRMLKIDAIVANNDQSAIGAIKALREEGIEVPTQVVVVGFDNVYVTTLIEPSLSTIDVPKYEMGFEAFRLLLKKIENPDEKPECRILEAKFIERKSSNENYISEWDLEGW